MPKRRINMKDIAIEANVSVATVSYVINKRKDQTIAPSTIKRVEDAVKKLGYVPNMAAKSLVENKSYLIGVVIPQTEPGKQFMFSNPFYGELLSSIEFSAREKGYHVLISGTDIDQSYLEIANKRSLDGIIIVGIHPDDYYENLKNTSIPVVLIDSYCNNLPFNSISIKDRESAKLAIKYFIKKGHKKIAFASGVISDNGVTYERFLGYKDALKEANIKYNENYVFSGTVSQEYGKELGISISSLEDRPTAIFSTADIIAFGLINGLKKAKVNVPEDVSIIGFDDTWIARDCDPLLTTIKQDVFTKGKKAVELILNNDGNNKENIVLDIQLIERESVFEIRRDNK
ncbi:MAG: LacI family DNA-binding transcriptional regulator [Pleomorphochaeta sp.]